MPKRPKQKATWIYVVSDGTAIKIGLCDHVESRMADLQGGNPRRLKLHAAWHMRAYDYAYWVEQAVLRAGRRHRVCGEWLAAKPEAVTRLVNGILRNVSGFIIEPHDMRDVRLMRIQLEMTTSKLDLVFREVGTHRNPMSGLI